MIGIAMLLEGLKNGTTGEIVPVAVDSTGRLIVAGVTLEAGTVNIGSEVEVKNDSGNPIPVVAAASRTASSATIANGAALSGTLDLVGTALVGFSMPAAWTAAQLSIEVSNDGTNWLTPYDQNGSQAGLVSSPAVSCGYAVDVTAFLPWRYIRFKSSVNQGAARTITYVTRPLA